MQYTGVWEVEILNGHTQNQNYLCILWKAEHAAWKQEKLAKQHANKTRYWSLSLAAKPIVIDLILKIIFPLVFQQMCQGRKCKELAVLC